MAVVQTGGSVAPSLESGLSPERLELIRRAAETARKLDG